MFMDIWTRQITPAITHFLRLGKSTARVTVERGSRGRDGGGYHEEVALLGLGRRPRWMAGCVDRVLLSVLMVAHRVS